MDLVSFESAAEYNWVKGFINGKQYLFLSSMALTPINIRWIETGSEPN